MKKQTYLAYDGKNYKIGKSVNAENRISQCKTANPEIQLLVSGYGISEKELHDKYKDKRVDREWFSLNESDVEWITEKIESVKAPPTLPGLNQSVEKVKAEMLSDGKQKESLIRDFVDFLLIDHKDIISMHLQFTKGVRMSMLEARYKSLVSDDYEKIYHDLFDALEKEFNSLEKIEQINMSTNRDKRFVEKQNEAFKVYRREVS
jgi:hypothetical protein